MDKWLEDILPDKDPYHILEISVINILLPLSSFIIYFISFAVLIYTYISIHTYYWL